MSNPILKVSFTLDSGREIVMMDTVDGKLQQVSPAPNWNANGKSDFAAVPKAEKKSKKIRKEKIETPNPLNPE